MVTGLLRGASLALGALVWWLGSPPAWAADCTIVCTPPANTSCECVDTNPGDPCIITTNQNDQAPGAVIDCSGMDLVLRARIDITGTATLRADDVTIETTNRIKAVPASGLPFGMNLELTGTLDVTGALEANSDAGGGSISVNAGGDILIRDTGGGDGVLAQAMAPGGHGGRIELVSAEDVELFDHVRADGAQIGSTRGGRIVVDAAQNLTGAAKLSAFGHQVSGGVISLTARDGALELQNCGVCFVKAEGGDQDGNGGEIYLSGDSVIVGVNLSAQGGYGTGGGRSRGGGVRIEADAEDGTIAINADINVTSGEAGAGMDGGAIVAESEGDLTVANGVDLVTKSDANGGAGGNIRLSANGLLTIGSATIDARGDWGGGEGAGASVDIEGCGLTVSAGAVIDARGFDGGAVTLAGRETATISASSSIDTTGMGGDAGSIVLAHRRPGRCSAGSDPTGCDPGKCLTLGTCTNDPTRQCTSNANCTIGCQTGQCVRRCRDDLTRQCTTGANCEPCTSGQCVANPSTGNTTAQFIPAVELDENRNLVPCND